MKTLALILLLLQQTGVTPIKVPELLPPTRQAPPVPPAESPILREAIALYDQGKYDEALARYEQLLQANPENVAPAAMANCINASVAMAMSRIETNLDATVHNKVSNVRSAMKNL